MEKKKVLGEGGWNSKKNLKDRKKVYTKVCTQTCPSLFFFGYGGSWTVSRGYSLVAASGTTL